MIAPVFRTIIEEAIASGDPEKMKVVAHQTEQWLERANQVREALRALNLEIAKLESRGAIEHPSSIA